MSERTHADVQKERINLAIGVSLAVDSLHRAQNDDAVVRASNQLADALDHYIARATQGWVR